MAAFCVSTNRPTDEPTNRLVTKQAGSNSLRLLACTIQKDKAPLHPHDLLQASLQIQPLSPALDDDRNHQAGALHGVALPEILSEPGTHDIDVSDLDEFVAGLDSRGVAHPVGRHLLHHRAGSVTRSRDSDSRLADGIDGQPEAG